MRLILASQSRARRDLLEQAGLDVDVIPSGIDEPDLAGFPDIGAGLQYLALWKARVVRSRGVVGTILACDTVSHVHGQLLGKPTDRDDAERMLRLLSGSTHDVLTGWCLLRSHDDLHIGGVERTEITMRPWTEADIAAYLDSGEWEGRCGGYGLQLPHDPFVTDIRGSAANVIGVPLERVQQVLAEFPAID
ncbi:MAG: Maf family protein [Planctomycetales bacterium]|nr:Maf family protein [Planctomycetales bacterium]